MEISILWCRSVVSGKEFPVAQLSADTDMGTDGWVSLTSTERREVIVTRATPQESSGDARALQRLEARINRALGRTDLRAAELVRVQERVSNAAVSFQQFRKAYQPPTLFFRDILSRHGEAMVVREVSLREFEQGGGICTRVENV